MKLQPDHVVFDVEIQRTIEELKDGWDATDEMGVACACVYEYRTDRMRIYGPDEVGDLKTRLLTADIISGFNIFNFDYPCVWGIHRNEWVGGRGDAGILRARLAEKTNDVLRNIWVVQELDPDKFVPMTHGGWSLNAVGEATLGSKKIGHGAEAPKWHQAGQWAKVANYCADDVALERDLVDFIEKYGYVTNGKRRVRVRNRCSSLNQSEKCLPV